MSLDVDPSVEDAVRERAAAEGITVDAFLERTLGIASHNGGSERRVRTLLAQWQAEDATRPAPYSGEPGVGSSTELFERWNRADAAMTDEEREAEDRLWEDVMKGLDETREVLGMRRLSP